MKLELINHELTYQTTLTSYDGYSFPFKFTSNKYYTIATKAETNKFIQDSFINQASYIRILYTGNPITEHSIEIIETTKYNSQVLASILINETEAIQDIVKHITQNGSSFYKYENPHLFTKIITTLIDFNKE